MEKKLTSGFVLLFVFTCVFCNCSTKNNVDKTYEDMKCFVLDEECAGYGYLLFVNTNGEKKGCIDAFSLHRDLLYDKKYKGLNKDSLYKSIIYGEYLFNCEHLSFCFTPNDTIISFYKKNSISSFIKEYSWYSKYTNRYVINKLPLDDGLTVIYCLYLNGIYTSYDGGSGYYVFTKQKPKPIKTEEIELLEYE